jgi:hypothetical protein
MFGLCLATVLLPQLASHVTLLSCLLLQLPRQLGVLGSRLVAEGPYKAGPIPPLTLARTVAVLLKQLAEAVCSDSDPLKKLIAPIQQQMFDSGFITCLQQLMEATAEQLERCTAAAEAAAPAGDSRARFAAAAGIAAAGDSSVSAAATSNSRMSPAVCLEALQFAAWELMEAHMGSYCLVSTEPEMPSLLGRQAASTHLSVACMRHISALVQPTDSQQAPAKSVMRLAYVFATSTAMAAKLTYNDFTEMGPRVLLGKGPHFVAWSDVVVLLVTYAHILQQHCQLPAVEGMAGFSTGSGTDPAAAAGSASRRRRSSSSSTSGSSSRSRQQQQQQQGLGFSVPNSSARAAWQDVHGQWNRVPATHKQLLQLLGVSPQAAVWLAGILTKQPVPLPEPLECWTWNPHCVASNASLPPEGPSGSRASRMSGSSSPGHSAVLQLQQQLQEWSNMPL